jgi:hypothetical protein
LTLLPAHQIQSEQYPLSSLPPRGTLAESHFTSDVQVAAPNPPIINTVDAKLSGSPTRKPNSGRNHPKRETACTNCKEAAVKARASNPSGKGPSDPYSPKEVGCYEVRSIDTSGTAGGPMVCSRCQRERWSCNLQELTETYNKHRSTRVGKRKTKADRAADALRQQKNET